VRSVFLVSNPRAGSANPRRTQAIAKVLSADFKLEVGDTTARDHATELARDAVDRGFDAVIALGGDGTINEVAQGVVGTDVALGVIPGGSTNVMVRSLGLPVDPIEAAVFAAERLRSGTRRRVNVGRIDERYFLFSAGLGLDAEVVKRVEADPEAKRRRGDWFFLSNALKVGVSEYRNADPWLTLEVEGAEPERVVLVVCCKARPFTYFKRFPVDPCPQARLDAGLDFLSMTRISTAAVPRLVWALLVSRAHIGWKNARYEHDRRAATVTGDRPFPVQVDGDYIGERSTARLELVENALDLLI
jgi:diacylglycerol kinase family enzyme